MMFYFINIILINVIRITLNFSSNLSPGKEYFFDLIKNNNGKHIIKFFKLANLLLAIFENLKKRKFIKMLI